jgi:hypothetical protein
MPTLGEARSRLIRSIGSRTALGPSGSAPLSLVWQLCLPMVFAITSAQFMLAAVLVPASIGSHALIYADAARAWVTGGNPWSVGAPQVLFAGPPPMLVPFIPFMPLPLDVVRIVWSVAALGLALVVFRTLHMPGWWLGYPPIFQTIYFGHLEIMLLALILLGGRWAGLAALVKPYIVAPLLAEKRWRALSIGLAVLLASSPLLPWVPFLGQLPAISATLARQSGGDSTFGQPALMVVAIVALASLGLRRALWLAAPVLWPAAQPLYKVACLPATSPILALFWAIPIPGATLVGIVLLAVADRFARTALGPRWLATGVDAPGLRRLSPAPGT